MKAYLLETGKSDVFAPTCTDRVTCIVVLMFLEIFLRLLIHRIKKIKTPYISEAGYAPVIRLGCMVPPDDRRGASI